MNIWPHHRIGTSTSHHFLLIKVLWKKSMRFDSIPVYSARLLSKSVLKSQSVSSYPIFLQVEAVLWQSVKFWRRWWSGRSRISHHRGKHDNSALSPELGILTLSTVWKPPIAAHMSIDCVSWRIPAKDWIDLILYIWVDDHTLWIAVQRSSIIMIIRSTLFDLT